MRTRGNLIRRILLAVVGAVFLFSLCMVVKYHLEMHLSARQAQQAQLAVSEAEEAAPEPENELQTWVPLEPSPIRVDFDALLQENEDVVAWLYCPGTPIHYPVAQAEDNAYYLHRLLDGSRNSAGTLFMDYRCTSDLSAWNSVIYGHNMKNDSMFGTLSEYKNSAWYEAHPVIYVLTPEQNYALDLFAGFVTSTDSPLYTTYDADSDVRAELIESCVAASDFTADFTPVPEDRLLTLSTCSYEFSGARYVLVGVLRPLAD